MSEKRVTTDELEAIAFDEGGRISLGLSEARYTDAGGVHYVADLPRADHPKLGDERDDSWRKGCGEFSTDHMLFCSAHVGDYHVATGMRIVQAVWPR